MLLKILNRTDVPLLTTLHTVLDRPDTDQRRVMEAVIRRSARMIVMSEKGCDILRRVHGVPERDRKSVVKGTSVSVRVDLGGRRIINKKTSITYNYNHNNHTYKQYKYTH